MRSNRFFQVLLMLFLNVGVGTSVYSQSSDEFQEFVKQRQEFVKQRNQEFEKFRSDREAEFNRYREQYNREFAEYLRKPWKQATPKKKIVLPPQPKPFVPKPDDEVKPAPTIPKELPIKEVVIPQPTPPAPKPIVIDRPKEEEIPTKDCFIVLEGGFYGDNIRLRCNPDALEAGINLTDKTPSAIASAWEQLARGDWDLLIYECQQLRDKHNYCDWMYYQLVRQVACTATATTGYSHASVLLTGYILAHSGIDFRLASSEHELFLALPFDTKIFNCTYFKIDGKDYYVVEKEINTTCVLMNHSFSKEASSLALKISTPMHLDASKSKAVVLSSKKYPEMRVQLFSNQSLMSFYHSYPRMEWQEYTLAPMDEKNAKLITEAFAPVLAGKRETEKADMILNFVQTAFTYGYDDEIWGDDRPFFPDETLNYPQSDCEDRSILFANLIRKLTDLDIVLLHYPGHLATAIRFNEDIQGDYVLVNGQKYFVCDPTGYKPIGHAYDEFKNVQAKAIRIR